MGKVLGLAPETVAAMGTTSEESLVRDSSLVAPFNPRVGNPQTCARSNLNAQSCQGETGSTQSHSHQHTLAGVAVAGQESAREWRGFWLHLPEN